MRICLSSKQFRDWFVLAVGHVHVEQSAGHHDGLVHGVDGEHEVLHGRHHRLRRKATPGVKVLAAGDQPLLILRIHVVSFFVKHSSAVVRRQRRALSNRNCCT